MSWLGKMIDAKRYLESREDIRNGRLKEINLLIRLDMPEFAMYDEELKRGDELKAPLPSNERMAEFLESKILRVVCKKRCERCKEIILIRDTEHNCEH